MTGITKAMTCAILCGVVHIKDSLLLIERVAHVVVAAGYMSDTI